MGMGFAPTWLRQVTPPASQSHFNHCTPLVSFNHVTDPQFVTFSSSLYTTIRKCKCKCKCNVNVDLYGA